MGWDERAQTGGFPCCRREPGGSTAAAAALVVVGAVPKFEIRIDRTGLRAVALVLPLPLIQLCITVDPRRTQGMMHI
ncbi:hypothetical protein L210DRAFT_948813 [Boletus edulis BED1]|uniref:Uncharacterized protein n=1 Tax=Boletus edulis BED1 TaxID=1328754 RepID=A0AAD4GHF7_BOLED|nr:hypothetical protein L210DRAFT_948813 [Boletus edulis BED1]